MAFEPSRAGTSLMARIGGHCSGARYYGCTTVTRRASDVHKGFGENVECRCSSKHGDPFTMSEEFIRYELREP